MFGALRSHATRQTQTTLNRPINRGFSSYHSVKKAHPFGSLS